MNKEKDAIYYKQVGDANFTSRNLQIAYLKYTRALKDQPQHISALFQIARTFYRMQKYRTSEAKSRKLIILDPKDAMTHYNRGLTLDSLKKYEEAEISYRQALTYNPKHANGYHNLAIALMKQGEYEEASLACEKTIELDSCYSSAHNACGYLYLLQGEYEKAMLFFKKAIALDPSDCLNHTNKAVLLYLMREEEEVEIILGEIKKTFESHSVAEEIEIYELELDRLERQELIDENKEKQRKDCIKGIQFMKDFLRQLGKPEIL